MVWCLRNSDPWRVKVIREGQGILALYGVYEEVIMILNCCIEGLRLMVNQYFRVYNKYLHFKIVQVLCKIEDLHWTDTGHRREIVSDGRDTNSMIGYSFFNGIEEDYNSDENNMRCLFTFINYWIYLILFIEISYYLYFT